MAKDEQTAAAILQQWNNNIDSPTDLFASMNPYWAGQWHDLLYRALQLSYQQIMALIANECSSRQHIRSYQGFDDHRRLSSEGNHERLTEIPDILNKLNPVIKKMF